METRASYVMVGSFVMLCLLGLFVALIWLTGAQYRQEFAYYRTVFTGAVTGLGRGTTVRYNGIDVGSLTELAFDPEDPSRVIVTVQIDPKVPLHVDSVASIESQGFTGATYLEIAGGTAASPILKAQPGQQYPLIPSKPNTLQQLAQAGPELVARFNTVGERVGDLLNDENRKAIAESLANLRNTTEVFDRRAEDLDATLENLRTASAGMAKTLGNVDTTLSNANRALASADHALESVDGAVDTLKTSLTTTLASTDATVQRIGKLSEDADKLVTGQSVAQLTQMLAQTRALIASLTRLSQDLEREPTKLLFGDKREGYTPK
jgi:phospholipid/cholesterol/gamma-HCH transport system substrate-binding protein